ncbi:hypothetical protein ILUMI_06531 [Ignelater luminosus]|uniref:Reverse transcriptase domain-containing protein n=1 Tax=Ignelater luminosus TaxID=2038154 RepID=A0A8K0D882_IGNLU|nr:hypothetical protein ILUMI_06531 [Ignelater luminosus]
MDDMNAKIGKGREDSIIGDIALANQNDRGDRFARFCAKALDRVQHDKLLQTLKTAEVDDKDIRIIENLYWHQSANVQVGNQLTNEIEIKRGVRQGCILSPLLFNLHFEQICKEALDDTKAGIIINGQSIPIPQEVKNLLAVTDLNSSNFNKDHNAEQLEEKTVNLRILDTFIPLDDLQSSEEEIDIETCLKIKYELSEALISLILKLREARKKIASRFVGQKGAHARTVPRNKESEIELQPPRCRS